MSDLKLLEDLEKLNGLPLEKEGQEIKNSLKISDEMMERVKGITKPYILISGKRAEAIRLAAYIYLSKNCSVCSDVDLHEVHNKYAAAVSLFRKTEKGPRKAKKGEKIYLSLFHCKSNIDDTTRLHTNGIYVNKKTGRVELEFSIGDYQHDLDQYDLTCKDFYYKGNRDTPDEVKGSSIEITYQNHFRFVVDRKNSRPETLNTLKIIDEGDVSMTLSDMLKFKNTVFCLDFMRGVEDEDLDRKSLSDFSDELHDLRKGMPGSLIIHVDSKHKWPKAKSLLMKDFLEQFEEIPAKIGTGNIKEHTEDGPKELDDIEKKYRKLIEDVLGRYNKPLKEVEDYPSIDNLTKKIIVEMKELKLNKTVVNKKTGESKLTIIHPYNTVKTRIQGRPLYDEIMDRKGKLREKRKKV